MGPGKGIRASCTAGREKKNLRSISEERGSNAIIPRQEKPSLEHLQARGVRFT